ncbi:fibronectin type III domain-containing protein [Methanimicrococcus sp. OttesenSCG-928-J09]|nr:fibronectin type III domain-containing protein [Methanimicrococcus sp. OttesenSCG-928-J09]
MLTVTILPIASAEAPDAPMNLCATVLGANTIQLTWEPVDEANYYCVYQVIDNRAELIDFAYSAEFTIMELKQDTVYTYRVSANSAGGEGRASNDASATTKKLSAPQNVRAQGVSDSKIKIDWNAVSGAYGYYVYRADAEDGEYTRAAVTPLTNFDDNGLKSNETYYYKIVAYDGYTIEGTPSDPVSATTFAKPVPKAEAESSSSIKVYWKEVQGATSYNVYRSTNIQGLYAYIGYTSLLEFRDTGLDHDTTYYYKVSTNYKFSSKENIEGSLSEYTSAKTLKQIGKPTLTAEALNTREIELRWTSVEDATHYQLYKSPSEFGPFSIITEIEGTDYIDAGLTPDTEYYYYVIAWVGQNSGHPSNIAFAATPKPIGIPDVEAEALTTSSIKVTWNEITDAFDYNIYRSETEDGVYKVIGVVGKDEALEYVDTGLDHSTTYYYKVAVYNEKEMGEQSAPASATTKTPEAVIEKPTNPGNGGSQTVRNELPASEIKGFEKPIEPIDAGELREMSGAWVLQLFLLLAVMTAGILYVRARRRAKNLKQIG